MADDDRDKREEEAAAAEAGRIGGRVDYDDVDESERPLAEGGEGVSEGYELAESDHRRNAEHDDGEANPFRDAPGVEPHPDNSVHGEPDHIHASGDDDSRDGGGDENPDQG